MDMMAQMLSDPTFLFLAVLVVTVAVLLMRVQRHYGRSRSASAYTPPARPEPVSRARPADGPLAMAAWEVQMHETARELKGQLDSKMGLLEQLVREADRAASRLEAALAAAPQAAPSAAHATPSEPVPMSAAGDSPAGRPAPDAAEPTLARPGTQAEALKAAGLADRPLPAAGEESPGHRSPMERRYEEIYTLADYGYDAAEIAQRVGTPVGEVQLILGLRAKR